MAKSIRSKIKKRLRTAKRHRMDVMVIRPREEKHFAALTKQMQGQGITLSKPRNAFRHPDAKDAIFPQREIMKPIDFRSSHNPLAGYTYGGNRRKYEGEQKEYMDNLAKTCHPKMEVLAGGGAVLSTGEKVSMHEAEMIATAIRKPEEAAAAAAAQPSAASAVSAAVDATPPPVPELYDHSEMLEPVNKADSSRRPIVKDLGRQKRVAENQAKKTKTSRVHKPNPAAPVQEAKKKAMKHKKAAPVDVVMAQEVKKKAMKQKKGDGKDGAKAMAVDA